jgi:hypothetical protein
MLSCFLSSSIVSNVTLAIFNFEPGICFMPRMFSVQLTATSNWLVTNDPYFWCYQFVLQETS